MSKNTNSGLPSVEELVGEYQGFSDIELMRVCVQIHSYSEDAQKALAIVLKQKGGYEAVKGRADKEIGQDIEIQRVKREASAFIIRGHASVDIASHIASDILPPWQIDALVQETVAEAEAEFDDVQVKPKTIGRGIIGAVVGGTISGVLFGGQMIYTGEIFWIIILGCGIISYGFVTLFTKQSIKNTAVQVLTGAAVIYAVMLGMFLLELFGYKGG
jgi:hypothetical protein